MQNSNRARGSALLATLVMTFIMSLLILGVTLLVNAQGRVNRQQAQHQTSRAEIERFAEEVYGTYTALMNHDGTLSDHHLPHRARAFITSATTYPNCTREYAADPTLLEIGIITVNMRETCTNQPNRQEKLTYQLSPDTNSIVSLLDTEPSQVLHLNSMTLASALPYPTFHASITSSAPGYIRVHTENPDPDSLQARNLIIANQAVTPGAATSFTITDTYGTPSAGTPVERHLKILYSSEPFPTDPDALIRWACPTGMCGATSVLRVQYTLSGTSSIIPAPTL